MYVCMYICMYVCHLQGFELLHIQLEASLLADLLTSLRQKKNGDTKGSPITNRSSQLYMICYSARQSLFAQTDRSSHWHPVTVSFTLLLIC